ncbi:primosomal replication protein PriC [Idiomarina seosinensis]|uniref:primosomal replication protein PriC n=1 Tax=Idiomarina seosinensis TaxID=281739 RepID=UPI0013007D5E|nr:primosomal replication protein PriC [Idiomarina seosinensis]
MQQLDNILSTLTQQAEQLDQQNRRRARQLSEQWFSAGLFKCRSSLAIDYVAETQSLWKQLQSTQNTNAKDFLAEQISQQLLALTTALNGSSLPVEGKDRRLSRQSHLAALHQQLVTYRDYEHRLQQRVESLQQQQDTEAAQQQEKRLNRCQQAIIDLEHKIQRHEEGR